MDKREIKLPYTVAGACFHKYVKQAPVQLQVQILYISFEKHNCNLSDYKLEWSSFVTSELGGFE